jgi:hypothetical protein
MMRTARSLPCIAALVLLAASTVMSGAVEVDPDWPCIQRRVPELSLGQIWTGQELPAETREWSADASVSDLVREVAARRVPLPEAQDRLREFATGLPAADAELRLLTTVRALFDYMNAERSQIISGIARYARKQRDLAESLRQAGSELDTLRARPDADPNDIERRTERLTLQTRIFDERVQSLTYVCEVPTLIEQRLYALVKTVGEIIDKK